MKVCRVCEVNKEINQFHKSKTAKDGRQRICRECTNAELSTDITCDSCGAEKKASCYYRSTTGLGRMTTCKECYGPKPHREGPNSSYWIADPVDTSRMIEVLGISIVGLKKHQQIDLWNNQTNLVLPRMSMRGKELTALE